jgi:G3E family GTPase
VIKTDNDRVPVTLLTGFLGAGKTTLLNHIIRDPDAGRIAVIINEFGDIGLDHDLIEAATEETILMQSGCVCCSIRGDLINTLGALMARRNRDDLDFDRVIIETTGIADPGPILHSLVVDQIVGPYYHMDGIVTLVDAATGSSTLAKQFEAVHQAAVADILVITKTDLAGPEQITDLEQRLDTINNTAQRIWADRGRVAAGALFGLSAMRAQASSRDLAEWLGQTSAHAGCNSAHSGSVSPSDSKPTAHAQVAPKPHAHHDHHIVSAAIELADPIAADVFDFWLDSLIALRGSDILRVKGIVFLEDMDWPFVFHGVQHIFDAPVPLKSWSGKGRSSRVVVIAREMDEDALKASLQTLRIQSKEASQTADGIMVHSAEMPF